MQISGVEGFEWDEGNALKNWLKHRVSMSECESLFQNIPLLLMNDDEHSQDEQRWYALGITNEGRKLFVAFTVRGNKIRVISARPMSKAERQYYEQA